MSNAQNSAKVIDFQAFKERRTQQEAPVEKEQAQQATPLFAWYPIWVMVPQFPYA